MAGMKETYSDYYVYIHKRNDTGEVFYVGKGTSNRAWQRGCKRNKHWNRIVEKHGHTVEIFKRWLTNDEAIAIEKELIAHYGRKNLCNMTDGGEGGGGREWSEISRKKLSESKRGKPNIKISGDRNHMKTEESRMKLSQRMKGKKRPDISGEKNCMHRPEMKALVSARCKGKKRPDITGANHKLSKKVICIETGDVFDCGPDAVKWLRSIGKNSAVQSNISSACTGKLKTAYGFHWKHA